MTITCAAPVSERVGHRWAGVGVVEAVLCEPPSFTSLHPQVIPGMISHSDMSADSLFGASAHRSEFEFRQLGLRVEAKGHGRAQHPASRGNVHISCFPSHRAENKPGAPVVMAGAPSLAAMFGASA